MKITLDTIKNNSFRSGKTKKPKEDKTEQLKTSTDFLANKTKLAVGCCFAAAIAIDILYFTVKRNIKYDKIAKAERLALQKIESLKNAPKFDVRF